MTKKLLNCPVYRHHLKTGQLENQTLLNHLDTRLVKFLNAYCTLLFSVLFYHWNTGHYSPFFKCLCNFGRAFEQCLKIQTIVSGIWMVTWLVRPYNIWMEFLKMAILLLDQPGIQIPTEIEIQGNFYVEHLVGFGCTVFLPQISHSALALKRVKIP